MSFICEPHSEMWAVDTGCIYCREFKLEAENAKLEALLTEAHEYLDDSYRGMSQDLANRIAAALEVKT